MVLGTRVTEADTRRRTARIRPGRRAIARALRLCLAVGVLALPQVPLLGCTRAAARGVTLVKPAGSTLYTEVPFWFLTVPQIPDRAFLATTSYTNLCRTIQAADADTITITAARKITEPEDDTLWARSYNGAYSAATLHAGTPQQMIVLGQHGENKNQRFVDAKGEVTFQQNTVAPLIRAQAHASGYNPDGSYTDDYAAYFQFTSVRWMPSTAANGYLGGPVSDVGPVAWPQAGYIKPDGTSASNGVGQGTLFAAPDGHLYFYYRDSSEGSDGIKVVRAPIAGDAWKEAASWRIYNAALADPWSTPSLPAGFAKESAARFLATPGNPGTPIAQHHTFAGRFAIAQVRDSTPVEYRAVEEYSPDARTWIIRLLTSTDLVTWTPLSVLQQGPSGAPDALNYPILLDRSGSDHDAIDPDRFFVVGSAFGSTIPQRRLVTGGRLEGP